MSKHKYVLHYRNVQLYTSLGLKVKQVHRVIEFNQKPWMAPFIKMNTELRKAAKSDFGNDFFKLMNTSVFGKKKSVENLRKRINVHHGKGVNEIHKLRKLIVNPSFNAFNPRPTRGVTVIPLRFVPGSSKTQKITQKASR